MKRQLLIIAVLILIAAAVNPLVAVMFLKSRTSAPGVPVSIQLSGEEAAAEGWPVRGPHEQDWPLPTRVWISEVFGFTKTTGWYENGVDQSGRCSMEVHRMGWPLPVLERRQFSWSRNDPTWTSAPKSNPAMNILWTGAIVTPIAVGLMAWLVLVFPLVVGVHLLRRLRRLHRRCENVNDPMDTSSRCSDSGPGSSMESENEYIDLQLKEQKQLAFHCQGAMRQLQVIATLILIAAALNPLVSVMYIRPPTESLPGWPRLTVGGSEAAAIGWPVRGPHEHEWPDPTLLSISKEFGIIEIAAWHSNGADSIDKCSMNVRRMGWPFPVLERRQFWWPWKDPAWAITAESDPAMNIYWKGVVANPIIAGLAVWLMLFGPVLLWRTVRHARRDKGGLCLKCGYPIGVSDVCTECGADVGDGRGVEPERAG